VQESIDNVDQCSRGFAASRVNADRYDYFVDDPFESHGIALQNMPRGGRLLDVGCGSGGFVSGARDRLGCHVVGIEPHAQRALDARNRGIEVYQSMLTPELLAQLGSFDVITFLDVLEHVPDPVSLLQLAKSALNKNGIVIVSVPNIAHWTVRLKLLFGKFEYEPTGIMDATHLRWFTKKTLAQVHDEAGLKIVNYDVSRGTWMPFYSTRPILRHLSKERRRKLINRLCMKMPTLFGAQHVCVSRVA